MEYFLQWLLFLIVLFFIFFLLKKNLYLRNVLLTAFLIRLTVVVFEYHDLISLPDSDIDAKVFDAKAIEFSRNYGFAIMSQLFTSDGLLISRILSIFYTSFGESKMIAQGVSATLGTASVYLVYRICETVWDNYSARKAAWTTALFPTLILYSSLILREAYVVFFLLFSLLGITKFIINKSTLSFFQTLTGFFIISLLHGPTAIGGLIFLFYVIFDSCKIKLRKKFSFKIKKSILVMFIISLIAIILFLTSNIRIPYLGTVQTLFSLETIISGINLYMYDAASYPKVLYINDLYELVTKGLIKIFYFLFSPFIWDIKKESHILGLFDGILYFIIMIYVIKNWYYIMSNPIARFFFLLFLTYLIVFGLSVGNFGTGIRHRSKFVVIIIILAAPKINKFLFSIKRLYKK